MIPDVPLAGDGKQYIIINQDMLPASRPEHTFLQNTIPTLIHLFISQARILSIWQPLIDMGPLPDVPLVDVGHQYKTNGVVMDASRPGPK